mgnify:CR=1 FL=1
MWQLESEATKASSGSTLAGLPKIGRRGRSRHGVAADRSSGVIARIFLINKFRRRRAPTQVYFVFGHFLV